MLTNFLNVKYAYYLLLADIIKKKEIILETYKTVLKSFIYWFKLLTFSFTSFIEQIHRNIIQK